MAILFSSRATIGIFGEGVVCRASWPFGSVTFDAEAFTFDAVFKSYRLSLKDIERIEFGWFGIKFVHRAPDVPSLVQIRGFGLSRRLQDAIQQHQLNVQIRA